jgi:hypothetical protein
VPNVTCRNQPYTAKNGAFWAAVRRPRAADWLCNATPPPHEASIGGRGDYNGFLGNPAARSP